MISMVNKHDQRTGDRDREQLGKPSPAHPVVDRQAFGLSEHQHEQEGDDNRSRIDGDIGHAQELGSLVEEEPGGSQAARRRTRRPSKRGSAY
jgi:hypothetical protein